MKLTQLFASFSQWKFGETPTVDVGHLEFDSRKVNKKDVFVAIRGSSGDGHKYLKDVCAKEVAAVVVEDESQVPHNFRGAVLVVKSTRQALDHLAAQFYGSPGKKLFNVGVTGTNGKTSVTYMIESVLKEFGWDTGVIGTVDHHLNDHKWPTELTTPDPLTLQKRLSEFVALGAKATAFEVSSHALDQDRADSIPFDVVVFTNLTRDHLDYHKTMEDYFLSKEKLFLKLPALSGKQVTAVINTSDSWGAKIRTADSVRLWSYGESKSDFQFEILKSDFSGSEFELKTPRGDHTLSIPLVGRHNVYNSVAALATGVAAGASVETCAKGLSRFRGVPGRLERVQNSLDVHVFVDYAHTDDALRTVLTALKEIRERARHRNKIIVVFGCGGDRDRGKRPLMAKAAIEGADLVVITSDNPRTEDPVQIIQEISSGIPRSEINKSVFIEVDRKEAIRSAISMAKSGDVVVIAGKGHEDYQIIGTRKFPFSDQLVAQEILSGL